MKEGRRMPGVRHAIAAGEHSACEVKNSCAKTIASAETFKREARQQIYADRCRSALRRGLRPI
jgi:hypothetical protein